MKYLLLFFILPITLGCYDPSNKKDSSSQKSKWTALNKKKKMRKVRESRNNIVYFCDGDSQWVTENV